MLIRDEAPLAEEVVLGEALFEVPLPLVPVGLTAMNEVVKDEVPVG